MESVMMDTMYEVPSDSNVGICTVTKDAVDGKEKPEVVYRDVTVPKKHCPEDPEKMVTGRSRNGRRSPMRKMNLQDPYPADKRAAAHRNVTAAFLTQCIRKLPETFFTNTIDRTAALSDGTCLKQA